VFNAALVCQYSKQYLERDSYLQIIINNSDELEFVERIFVGIYITNDEWQKLKDIREVKYDPTLRQEFKDIQKRDQLFRPMYETHDDTINANRIINLNRILNFKNTVGFPSHFELGYTKNLRGQYHDIVLHHTAQRRSRDKTITDLEAILFEAVNQERFDPEKAIFYLNFQNDLEKEKFEVYSTWQHKHPLLPDSLNNKIWLTKLDANHKEEANRKRKEWQANSLGEIAKKTSYLTKSNLPFIFTCVRKSIGNFSTDIDKETALKQYEMATRFKEEFKN